MSQNIKNIIQLAKENPWFRQEIITGDNSQVVVMSIPPQGEIGEEVHEVDQILVFVEWNGEAIIEGEVSPIKDGHLAFVHAGTTHNFRNTGTVDLKLYTIYAPPEHEPGTVHKTKAEAEAEEE